MSRDYTRLRARIRPINDTGYGLFVRLPVISSGMGIFDRRFEPCSRCNDLERNFPSPLIRIPRMSRADQRARLLARHSFRSRFRPRGKDTSSRYVIRYTGVTSRSTEYPSRTRMIICIIGRNSSSVTIVAFYLAGLPAGVHVRLN